MSLRVGLWEDRGARVPFAAIGVLLVLVSVLTTGLLVRLDAEAASGISLQAESPRAAEALELARSDVRRALSYSALQALREMGEEPVEADFTGEYGNDSTPFHVNRARGRAQRLLDRYLESNYRHPPYRVGEFSVSAEPVGDWRRLEAWSLSMKLGRTVEYPLPLGGLNTTYDSYLVARVPVNLTLRRGAEVLLRDRSPVETLVPARTLLLRGLTQEAERRMHGAGPLAGETTAVALGWVWARSGLQWATLGTSPGEVLSNRHVERMVNALSLLDRGFLFQATDPMAVAGYLQESLGLSRRNALKQATQPGGAGLDLGGESRATAREDCRRSRTEGECAGAEEKSRSPQPLRLHELIVCPLGDTGSDGETVDIPLGLTVPRGSRDGVWSVPGGYCRSGTLRDLLNETVGGNLEGAQVPSGSTRGTYTARISIRVERNEEARETGCSSGYSPLAPGPWKETSRTRLRGLEADPDPAPGTLEGEEWRLELERSHKCEKTEVKCSGEGESYTCRTLRFEESHTDARTDTVGIRLMARENSDSPFQPVHARGLPARNPRNGP
ncbi:MAG: hypothetical protein HY558_05130, partial [Euryarchaeota archaeon]|nr:hypothetical protein [Euryarchaeota archaeon]